ncbi:MAG TPA: alpha/beta hydrolase [Acidobacteriota bacterium]|jgi:pimeloyl-ACP methyl ester carboxylesterase|nr:alpha/beta hydrolase [Acidobacteriota bacterium]
MTPKINWKRLLKRLCLIVLGLLFLLLFVVAPLFLSAVVVNRRYQFPDPLIRKTPADFGMQYEEVIFSSPPDIRLQGWYLPGTTSRTAVIFCHGLNRSRVEMLPQAQFVHSLGLSGLLFDLRHHGRSSGNKSTFGAREKDDVLAAVAWMRDKQPHSKIILWGISMGAAAVMLAAAEDSRIDGVICDSTYTSFNETVDHHFRLFFRLPSWPIANEIRALIQWRGGFRGEEIDIREATRRLGIRPVMFVAQSSDRRMPADYARELFSLSTSPYKQLLILDGRRHGHAYRDHPAEYQQVVLEFLKSAGLL